MSRSTNNSNSDSSLFLGVPEVDRKFWRTLHPGHVHMIAVAPVVDHAAFSAEVALYHVSRSVKTYHLELSGKPVNPDVSTLFNNHFFSQKSGVPVSRLYPGYCTKAEKNVISAAVDEIRGLKSFKSFSLSTANLNNVNEQARSVSIQFIESSNTALELIIIDGFEHLSARSEHDRDPAAVAGQLKEIAIYYNVPVVIFASIPVPAGGSTSAPTAADVPWAGDVLPFFSFFALLYQAAGQISCRVAKNLLGKSGIQAVRPVPAPIVPFIPTLADAAALLAAEAAAAAEQGGVA